MSGPRILVMSASVGAGHLRAAEAVELALAEKAGDATVKNMDVLELTNKTFRRLYGRAYLDLVNKAPHVLGYLYDMMDRPRGPGHKSDRLRVLVEKLNLRPFLKLLREESWDAIVNTHLLPAEIVASLRRQKKLDTPHMTVTTDFETHRLWVSDPCERFTAATEEGALYLQHWGAPEGSVAVTGIPIHPVFAGRLDRSECLRAQGMQGKLPVVLQLAGGFGVGPIEKIFRAILSIETPVEVATVAGRNEALRETLEKVPVPSRHRVKVVGFTDRIHELMTVADVVVTKPGGLTSSEVLACGAAMAIVNPVPGQESRNSDYLLEGGAAIKVNNIATLPHKLEGLLRDQKRLARLKENASRLARPKAAFDIADIALELASGA